MKCPHCAKPVAIDEESCPHCGLRMPVGRVEMGGDTGCGIAVIFLLLVLVGACLSTGVFIPRWLWQFF